MPPVVSKPNAPDECVKVWQDIFTGGPYTGLGMLRYIKNQERGINVDDIMQTPSLATEITDKKIVDANQSLSVMAPTWAQKTGRCTSFAVKAIRDITAKSPGKYDFEIFNLAGHRVARCQNTGVVFDSSATMPGGAFVLPAGDWQRFEKTDASWKYEKSKSKFERNGDPDGNVNAGAPISQEGAMRLCLKGVASSASRSLPTLFRSISGQGIPLYHGMVCWAFSRRALDLVPDASKAKRKQKIVIQWATVDGKHKQGKQEEAAACVRAVEQFVKNYGGPLGERQWAADDINKFHDQLLAAAFELWGFPKLDDSTMPK